MLAMRPVHLALAALAALVLAAPVAAAGPCPPQMADHPAPDCTASPILLSLGECVAFFAARAHDYQVWAGETIACL